MKAITLHPEWAYAITELDKRIENRSWNPPIDMINQRFAIHAGKKIGGIRTRVQDAISQVMEMAELAGWKLNDRFLLTKDGNYTLVREELIVTGAIVAIATLRGVSESVLKYPPHWGVRGQKHWHFSDVDVLPTPIPISGKQRLWKLSNETVEEIRWQLGDDAMYTTRREL